MALTPAQKIVLAADVNADPAFDGLPHNTDGAFAIAVAYNLTAVPQFIVWITNLPTSEAKKAMVWTEFISRSAGERDAWQFMLSNGILNAADANVRQGIQDIFSGPAGSGTRAALVEIAKRDATRIEALLATGAGTNATPGTMTHEGNISYSEVQSAMGW